MEKDDWKQIVARIWPVPVVVGEEAATEKRVALIKAGLPDEIHEVLTHGVLERVITKALAVVGESAIRGDLDRFILDLPGESATRDTLSQRLAPAVSVVELPTHDPDAGHRASALVVGALLDIVKDFVVSHPHRDSHGRLIAAPKSD